MAKFSRMFSHVFSAAMAQRAVAEAKL